MPRISLIVTLVAACALALAAFASAGSSNDPRKMERDLVEWNTTGQYGRIWQSLHPRYRAVVARPFWEACQRKWAKSAEGMEVVDVDVTDSYRDTITLPLLGRTSVTAVVAKIRFRYLGQTHTQSATQYFAQQGGKWFGLWEPETYRAYKAHRCPK